MKLKFNYQKSDLFDINKNGIQIIDQDDTIQIYNDPFRTIPLFITRNKLNELIIFSEFKDYYDLDLVDRSVDEVGFWEIVIFGSGLWTRTLYKNVEQMPSATCITIDKKSEKYSISRYWNYNIKENKSIQSEEQAADGIYFILNNIFSKLDKKQQYLLGMSGGLDSRITLAFLAQNISKNNINLFTYGFDENILEYVYAKEIAYSLGVNIPYFHKLTAKSYKEAINYLPDISGGQISINHSHIIDYFLKYKPSKNIHISTYFSDAIFGWECKYPKKFLTIENNYYVEVLSKYSKISPEIKALIKADSFKVFDGIDKESNLSSLDEFKYITERNQKFHMFLANLQGKYVKTDCIYANMTLLRYSLSIPIKYRQNKNIIDVVLHKYFKNISSREFKNISSRFQWGSKFSGFFSWYFFRILNGANSFLRIFTNGKFQFFNKYQTEEHERILYRDFAVDLTAATSKFLAMGLFTEEQKIEFDKIPFRSPGVAERFAIISLAKIL